MKRLYNNLVVGLAVTQLLLVLLSWLLSASMTEGVRSMLSSEGVRWFFGSLVAVLSSSLLVWLLLLSIAVGCLWQSGLLPSLTPHFFSLRSSLTYRQRIALRTSLVVVVLYVAVILTLTAVPHAVLLSATGQLFPSAFSRALVPILAFGLCLISFVYGLMSGRFETLGDAIASLSFGIAKAAPLFILYILLMLLYQSVRFVFL